LQSGNPLQTINISDIDLDGKADLLVAGYNANEQHRKKMFVLRNLVYAPTVAVLCPPLGSVDFPSNITGSNYQWQVDNGNGFINVTDNSNYVGTNTNVISMQNIPSSWYGYKYRCIVDGVSSKEFIVTIQNNWSGGTDNNWENPANWACGTVPDENTDVVITGGSITVNSNITVRTMQVSAGAAITVAAGYNITVLH
jgi:hypothetical protein